MLMVKTPDEVREMIEKEFVPLEGMRQEALSAVVGKILAEDICATEYVPDFNRSTVDGYAVKAADTFGCSDSIPAVLTLKGQVLMGEQADCGVTAGSCAAVPTGSEVPAGADAVVMLEYTEDYGDGTIGILKSASPGLNMVYRGDDVKLDDVVLKKGIRLDVQDVGVLAAMGITKVPVKPAVTVGIISTGDELVPEEETPGPGQVRDVNSTMLAAAMEKAGAAVIRYGIVKDEEALLMETVEKALDACDIVLISGGSSVGAKDATCRVVEKMGTLLCHGIAMKPGKPTIFGKKENKAVIGLPGHPVAAMFITTLFVIPLLHRLEGADISKYEIQACLTESVSANHGRAQYMGVHLKRENGRLLACPVRGKSGLISSLAGTNGYFGIDRDCEGLAAGSLISVYTF